MMKMMKKFSLLVAIALLITVGGVYATWTYSQGTAPAATDQFNLRMATRTIDTKKGTISVVGTGFDMMINDVDDGTEYNAVLVLTGSITITFTPKSGADQDVIDYGIPMQYTLSISGPDGTTVWQYEEIDILTFPDGQTHLIENGERIKEYVIDADELSEKLQLGSFTLNTLDKYNAFNAALQGYQFEITVSEYIPTT